MSSSQTKKMLPAALLPSVAPNRIRPLFGNDQRPPFPENRYKGLYHAPFGLSMKKKMLLSLPCPGPIHPFGLHHFSNPQKPISFDPVRFIVSLATIPSDFSGRINLIPVFEYRDTNALTVWNLPVPIIAERMVAVVFEEMDDVLPRKMPARL